MMTDDNIKLKSSDHHHHAHNDDDDDDVKLKSNLMNIIRVWFWTWIFFKISIHLMVILIWEMVILVIISILLQQTKWSTQKRIEMKVNDNIIFFSDLLNNAYLDAAHDHNTITIINQKPEKKPQPSRLIIWWWWCVYNFVTWSMLFSVTRLIIINIL